jgi:ketosteroid isomerase-like protein
MSAENVEQVLRTYEALNRGDPDEAGNALHPDVEVLVPPMLPDPGPFRGREEAERFFAMWREIFDDFEIVVEETIDAGDQVLVMALVRGRGKDSGAVVVTPSFGHVWTLENGVATRIQMYPSRAASLEALGITHD